MKLFTKLPGFVKTPPGLERTVLRRLPMVLLFGTLVLGIPSLLIRFWLWDGEGIDIARRITTVDFYAISLVILHWTVVFTVAIAAFIVLVMKGPAYVADAYPLVEDDADEPRNKSVGR